MAANLATYGRNSLLNGVAMPATLHAKLHIASPGAAGTTGAAAEATRKAFTRTTATTGTCSNVAALDWTGMAADETITHISIWDAATSGNCWWQGPLAAPKAVTAGGDATIPIGDLDLTLT